MKESIVIDGLQYNNWDRELFQKTVASGIHAVHVTIAYWETPLEILGAIGKWHQHFRNHADLILQARTAADISTAAAQGKVAIIFGLQNCSPIGDDLGMVQILHELGVRIMQLSYNNQSLLAAGCYEENDAGITRFGKQVIEEMNRVGMVIDMSHSAEQSTLDAIEFSSRPIAITHANPTRFHAALRNKSDTVLKALADSGGMLGFSVYPFHLKDGPDCKLEDFCHMVVDACEFMGVDRLGIGSDLCQKWGYETLEWMRSGRWTFVSDFGEGSASNRDWPKQPDWFEDVSGFHHIAAGLSKVGLSDEDVSKIVGGNWLRFFEESFSPAA